VAEADIRRQIKYTEFRLAELESQRANLDSAIAYEKNVLAKLYETMVE
jgi:hypothetical protein